MGPPGAGKGTQAKKLVEKFGMTHLSSGDIFRAEKSSGSDLGKQLAQYMLAGKLVPDEIVVEMMAKAIADGDAEAGLMLDGFPRTVAQAKALDEQLAAAGSEMDAVVSIVVPDSEIVGRITGRRSCSCGQAYHVMFIPPKVEDVCDVCGAKLTQRADDTEEVVKERLEAYHAQTKPVIDYYSSCGEVRVLEVDGSKTPDEVSEDLAAALNALQQ